MKFRLAFFIISLLLFACGPDKKEDILGVWKIDSVYTYYNGFHFTRKDIGDEPLLEYLPDGKLKMMRGPESRMFAYDIKAGDTLIHKTPQQREIEKFFIENVDGTRLVLRRERTPIFSSRNQERYEVKFFSKQID